SPVMERLGLSQKRPSMQLMSVKQLPPAPARGAHVQVARLGRHAVVEGLLQEASDAAATALSNRFAGVQSPPGSMVPCVMPRNPSSEAPNDAMLGSHCDARFSNWVKAAYERVWSKPETGFELIASR